MLKAVLITQLILFMVLPVPALAQSAIYELTEVAEISALGYRINYPSGWSTRRVKDDLIVISEFEEDLEQALEGQFTTQGYSIIVERIPTNKIEAFEGLEGEPTLDDVLAANATIYSYQELTDQAEIEIFGVPALQVRTIDGMGNATLAVQWLGYAGRAAYVLTLRLLAPSDEKLDEFLPIWEAILDSRWQYTGLVQVGDYNINFDCAGTGSPPVIIVAGLEKSGYFYSNLQRKVAETTLVCTYDRPGTGVSDRPSRDRSRTSQDATDELYELLDVIGVQGPYVLVGHSIAGFQLRLFADQHPEEVLGMVLIDSSHEDQLARMADVVPEIFKQYESYFEGRNSEYLDVVASEPQIAAIDSDLGDLPLIVLTHDPGSPEYQDEFEKLWTELQIDLAGLSTNSTHIIVERTSHETIVNVRTTINAVIQLVEDLRGQRE